MPTVQETAAKDEKSDLLYIKSTDRLGRNYEEILQQWRMLTKEKAIGLFKGKEKKSLQEQIDNLNGSLSTANATKNNAVAPIQKEIDGLKTELKKLMMSSQRIAK